MSSTQKFTLEEIEKIVKLFVEYEYGEAARLVYIDKVVSYIFEHLNKEKQQ